MNQQAPTRLGNGLLACALFTATACGSSPSTDPGGDSGPSGSSSGSRPAGSSGSGSGSSGGSSGSSSGGSSGSSSGGSSGSSSGNSSGSSSSGSSSGSSGSSSGTDGGSSSGGSSGSSSGGAACVKGQVTPNQVVMIGDSYLDPAWANTSLDIFAHAQQDGALPANTTYRHYYLGGASMNSGALGLNIPYQYEQQALTDIAVPNPKDINTVIMDGGGNDVLIGNTSCETTDPSVNAGCKTTVDGAIARSKSLLREFGTAGIKNVIFMFYPHLDTAGGGILTTPAPAINKTLDYAYMIGAPVCTQSVSPKCVWIDTRAAFEGHLADYIKSDHVHPTPAGAQVIADMIWQAMKDNCIAQ